MLKLEKITKIYQTDEIKQKALDGVSINFRKNEFVSVLGQSGSGKSTLLNIIGGLDHYSSGDLIINDVSTKKYSQSDWDTYRNHKIGFIFQNYNLIAHQSVLSNVELALTLSGVPKKERIKRAKEALKKVGLEHHINKKPRQLSGGQMQRVAIARALVNNPDIILADEPTGALDSETSVQIMDLLKEIGKEKLIIMVTHNSELAHEYSTRIVELKDGKVISDTNSFDGKEKVEETDTKNKSSMSLLTALTLSKNNLLTKRGRTIVTAIAGSIGIIGIALVLSLSNGVTKYINDMQKNSFSTQPISIKNTKQQKSNDFKIEENTNKKQSHKNQILANDDISTNFSVMEKQTTKKNDTKGIMEYIEKNKDELSKYSTDIRYGYNVNIEVYDKNSKGEIVKVNPNENAENADSSGISSFLSTSLIKNAFSELKNKEQYSVVSGHMPANENEVALIVNQDNEINLSTMYSLDIEDKNEIANILNKSKSGEKVKLDNVLYSYDKIIGKKYKLINASDYYKKYDNTWVSMEKDNDYLNKLYNSGKDLEIVGILKVKDKNSSSGFLGYTHKLIENYINYANDSEIVKQQNSDKNINVLTGANFDNINSTYEDNMKIFGSASLDEPYEINIYPKKVDSKEKIKDFLDKYNKNLDENNKVEYQDDMESLTGALSTIVNMISFVMISFVSISLIVSSIMIGIITYISVLERTKEIGILRAIGASKKDVKRVFRAETIIEGLFAGCLGIVVSYLLSNAINVIVAQLAQIENITRLSIQHAIILIGVSVLLTVFAGTGPASMASKKDPVESLKTE